MLILSPDHSSAHPVSAAGPIDRAPVGTASANVVNGSEPVSWTAVWSGLPDRSFWKSTTALGAGYGGAKRKVVRSYFRFDTRAFKGKRILGAELNLRQLDAASCRPWLTDVYRTGPVGSRATWRNQPVRNALQSSSNSTMGCDAGYGMVGWDVTEAARYYARSVTTTATFLVRARSEAEPRAWKRFDSSNASLYVTYVSMPDEPTDVAVRTSNASTPCGTEAAPAVVGSSSVTLAATLSSADSYSANLTGVFRRRDTALTADEEDALGTQVASGERTTLPWEVSDGHVYRFQVAARSSWWYEGSADSMDSVFTDWCWFTVDLNG
ncbi:MAG TPA: DNRLRE domain-containing protein [Nocardioides sp.]|nr:DNRLRE domain-containing protein [Nocardioides sp.]